MTSAPINREHLSFRRDSTRVTDRAGLRSTFPELEVEGKREAEIWEKLVKSVEGKTYKRAKKKTSREGQKYIVWPRERDNYKKTKGRKNRENIWMEQEHSMNTFIDYICSEVQGIPVYESITHFGRLLSWSPVHFFSNWSFEYKSTTFFTIRQQMTRGDPYILWHIKYTFRNLSPHL